jgi:hypothetical protein
MIAHCLTASLLATCLVAQASAQEIDRFEELDIKKAVQCELGQFATEFYRVTRQPPSVEALVEMSLEQITAKAGQANANVVVTAGGGLAYERKQSDLGGEKLNVHPDNSQACRRRNALDTGILKCLRSKMHLFTGLGGYAQCSESTTATKSLKGGWKIQVWGYGIDASGDWSEKRTFSVKVRLPRDGFVGVLQASNAPQNVK